MKKMKSRLKLKEDFKSVSPVSLPALDTSNIALSSVYTFYPKFNDCVNYIVVQVTP